ncbi:hypothetical protein SCLCIDRAFT_25457 [Scleroderma citrinum Foug A]|uniref:Uncharacterized protein n=1 Tax=Scleroderma citrinum Foug A TaxID=1036808 RepID=A0A0C2ZK53_9AGAM|nr:hypothetical protein SCLCIDRAFT_25457 [Scleroderma citrinum Foug A]
MVDCGEVLEFELGVPGTEPFKERDFVVMEERSFKNVGNPLALLCMRRRIVDVSGNDGLTLDKEKKTNPLHHPPPQQPVSTPPKDALASNLELQVSSLAACLVDIRKAVETNKTSATTLLRTIDEARDDLHNAAQLVNDTTEELSGIPSQIKDAVSNTYPQQAMNNSPYRDALLMDADETPTPKAAPRTMPTSTDNTRANAAIKERQILLDIQSGHNIFNDDTPRGEMVHALQKALTNMQAPEGPSLQVKALTRIRNRGFVVEMESAEAAAWVRDPIRKLILMESLGGNIRLKDRTYNLLIPFVPITTKIEDAATLRNIE